MLPAAATVDDGEVPRVDLREAVGIAGHAAAGCARHHVQVDAAFCSTPEASRTSNSTSRPGESSVFAVAEEGGSRIRMTSAPPLSVSAPFTESRTFAPPVANRVRSSILLPLVGADADTE